MVRLAYVPSFPSDPRTHLFLIRSTGPSLPSFCMCTLEIVDIDSGTWKIPTQGKTAENVEQALELGFTHIDTAQAYGEPLLQKPREYLDNGFHPSNGELSLMICPLMFRRRQGNEQEVGQALKESGLARENIWVTVSAAALHSLQSCHDVSHHDISHSRPTVALISLLSCLKTKWSGRPWGNGGAISPRDSIHESLQKLGLQNVDLYLVHTPRLFAETGIREGWKQIEALQKEGLTKSIGVSNFTLKDMRELLEGRGGSGDHGHHKKHHKHHHHHHHQASPFEYMDEEKVDLLSKEGPPEIMPAANQIELHPYVWKEYQPNVDYCQKHVGSARVSTLPWSP